MRCPVCGNNTWGGSLANVCQVCGYVIPGYRESPWRQPIEQNPRSCFNCKKKNVCRIFQDAIPTNKKWVYAVEWGAQEFEEMGRLLARKCKEFDPIGGKGDR